LSDNAVLAKADESISLVKGFKHIAYRMDDIAASQGRQSEQHDLEKILLASRHLLDLISDILDISQIETGKMETRISTFTIPELIDDLARTLEPLMEKNNNRLEVDCPESMDTMISDHVRVRQILLNLSSNAAKFTENGDILLEVFRGVVDGQDWITFRVRDTGIGIAQDKLDGLFDAFTQVETGYSRRYEGTGLGLALVSSFTRMLGGDIHVESEPDKGSTFTVRLPADARGR